MDNIFQLVKKAEQNLLYGTPIKIGKYATHNHIEKIATIDAYLNSQHISGPTDSLGREKPFLNMVLIAAYTWFKTTDIDRKDILFKANNSKQRLKALVATILLRRWMNKQKFGQWLNQWGWKLACYGSAVSKFVEKDKDLIPSVISWDRLICDPVNFDSGIRAEKLYFTPSELKQQNYDKDAIERTINAFNEARKTLDGQTIDVKNEYIGVYEVHGRLPLSYLTGREEDENTYQQQMHVVFIEKNPKDKKSNIEITLYSGKERVDPYEITHLIEQEGRTLSIGAVESLFDPQWMINDSAKKAKDQLDVISKMPLQTADENFFGRNVVVDMDVSQVLIHKENKPISPIIFNTTGVSFANEFINVWKQSARDVAGTYEAVTGEQPPSGTPYSLQALLRQEARGLFKVMTQNKGLSLEEIIRKHVIPNFKKQLNTDEEVIAILDGEELETFDKLSLPARLSQQLLAMISKESLPSKEDLTMAISAENEVMGNTRILKPSQKKETWKEYFGDLIDALEIEITGENRDKETTILTLDTILQRMLSAPQMFSQKDIRKVLNKILDEVGRIISPLELADAPLNEATGGQPTGAGQTLEPMAASSVGALNQ
jgi:hypothetical protein